MSYLPLAQLLWSLGLGEQSEVLAEINSAVLNTVYRATIRPQAPWEFAVVHRVSLALPFPQETGKPIAVLNSITTTATTYTTVASWTVADDRSGELFEVSMDSSDFARTNWRLTIAGTQQFTGELIRSPLTLPFRLTQLPESAVVTLAAASTDGTSVTAYGSITGKEWPPYIFSIKPHKNGAVTQHTGYSSADLIRDGIATWAPISKQDPLTVDVENINGLGGEHFLAYVWLINTDAARIVKIKELARQMGVRETLGFGPPAPTGPARPASLPQTRAPVEAIPRG